jgi:anti-sigma B factor antagonist
MATKTRLRCRSTCLVRLVTAPLIPGMGSCHSMLDVRLQLDNLFETAMMQGYAATRQAGKVAIIDLSGGLTIGSGIGLLRNKIKELIIAGHTRVLLNLQGLKYLDSSGMGELVGACTTLRNVGGDLKLVYPQERVANLLRMTKLSTIFEVFADENVALQSF